MKVSELAASLKWTPISEPDAEREANGAYIGDLLSWVMGRASCDNVWITIMSNVNVVAVATLTEPAAIVLAEDVVLQDDALTAAKDNGLTVLSSPLSACDICVAIARFVEEMET